jgi:hypothetical protein
MPEPTAADRGRAAAVADAVARQSIGGAQEAFYAVGRDEWVSAIAAALAAVRAETREACAAKAQSWRGRRLAGHDAASETGQAFGRGVDMASHYIADDIRRGEAADA